MFDTLVRFDPGRLPTVEIQGRVIRSSAGRLHALGAEAWGNISLEEFYEAFIWSFREAERRRADDHREIPARTRLALCFERLGLPPESVPASLVDRLLDAHMAYLAGAAEPLPGLSALLDWLSGRYRLGVVSNFDYTPTVQRILTDLAIAGRFDTVVVSDGVGWRKPTAAIFQAAFDDLGVQGRECLFVGDRPEIDVLGAKGVGMAAAWLNPARTPLPAGLPAPDFDLPGLPALRTILEKSS
jgi:HAD superfamily hydrolase (TIGR01509 family)